MQLYVCGALASPLSALQVCAITKFAVQQRACCSWPPTPNLLPHHTMLPPQASIEETYLTDKFGEEYQQLIKTTKKFIPGGQTCSVQSRSLRACSVQCSTKRAIWMGGLHLPPTSACLPPLQAFIERRNVAFKPAGWGCKQSECACAVLLGCSALLPADPVRISSLLPCALLPSGITRHSISLSSTLLLSSRIKIPLIAFSQCQSTLPRPHSLAHSLLAARHKPIPCRQQTHTAPAHLHLHCRCRRTAGSGCCCQRPPGGRRCRRAPQTSACRRGGPSRSRKPAGRRARP